MRPTIALLLIVTLLAGCAGPVNTSIAISYDPPIKGWPPQVMGWSPNGQRISIQLPIIELHTARQTTTGAVAEYRVNQPAGEARYGSDRPMMELPTLPFTITINQPLSVTTDQAQAPAAWLWVVMEPNGNFLESIVLPSSQNTYTLTQPGDYVVKVLAEWDRKNYVAYLFRVAVVP